MVTEIIDRRVLGFGVGSADVLSLLVVGTTDVSDFARVERLDRFRGATPRGDFDELVELLRGQRFLELEGAYSESVPGTKPQVQDAPGVLVTAVRDAKRKAVGGARRRGAGRVEGHPARNS